MRCEKWGDQTCIFGEATAFVVARTPQGSLSFAKFLCDHHTLAWEWIAMHEFEKSVLRIYRRLAK